MEHCPGRLKKMLVSDRRTMPHDRCFVGLTKKVISTSGKGKEEERIGQQQSSSEKKTWGEEEKVLRVKKHENI